MHRLSPSMINITSKNASSKSEQGVPNESISPTPSDMTLSGKNTHNETLFKSDGMKWKLELSSMQNTLEFLAQAAGTVAKEGAKEVIKDESTTTPYVNSLHSSCQPSTDEGLKRLSGCVSAASDTPDENLTVALATTLNANKTTSQLIEEIGKVRPTPTRK